MGGCTSGWTSGWVGKRTSGWANGWMDEWALNKWADGRVGVEQMDGWTRGR